jgi:hypothetical protein
MITLRAAREQGDLERFVAEREGQIGDAAAAEATIKAMGGTSSVAHPASKKGSRSG